MTVPSALDSSIGMLIVPAGSWARTFLLPISALSIMPSSIKGVPRVRNRRSVPSSELK